MVAELQSKGSVRRGWLGVAIQPVTAEVADSLALKKAEGALVATVSPGSPAAKAGLKQGDIVLNFDGTPIATPRELSRTVADTMIGAKKPVTVWRDGREMKLDVRVGEMPKKTASLDEPAKDEPAQDGGVQLGALGLTLAPLDSQTRTRWKLDEKASGALVSSVDEQGNAAEKGLRPGDVITRVNQDAVTSPSDVASAVEKAKNAQRKSVLLLVDRRGEQHFVAVDLTAA